MKTEMRLFCADIDQLFQRIVPAMEAWPQEKKAEFATEWQALEKAGAEMVDGGVRDGALCVWLSDDFVRHLRKFGLEV